MHRTLMEVDWTTMQAFSPGHPELFAEYLDGLCAKRSPSTDKSMRLVSLFAALTFVLLLFSPEISLLFVLLSWLVVRLLLSGKPTPVCCCREDVSVTCCL